MKKTSTYLLIAVAFICSLHVMGQNVKVPKFPQEMLDNPQSMGKQVERKFNSMTISKFEPDSFTKFVILENGYAKSKIANSSQWPPKEKKYRVVEVQSVYTQYPKDRDFWLTNYHDLLMNRLKELFILDPTLNDRMIDWTMVLQTDCKTETEAQKMFHGFVIYYVPIFEDTVTKPKVFTRTDSVNYSKGYSDVQKFVTANVFAKERRDADSVVFKVFDRHLDWKNSLVVCDWTASMYAYASQAALWHSLNYKRSGIKQFALFNDGGLKSSALKKIGKVNSVYYCTASEIKLLVRLYNKVMIDGDGGDEPENDIEVLLRAINRNPFVKEVILIADNSCIRDYCLMSKISKPIRVIMCGSGKGINPQYINLAYKSGGSIHTIESDIDDLRKNIGDEGGEVKIDDFEYIFNVNKRSFEFKLPRPQEVPDCSDFDSPKRCSY